VTPFQWSLLIWCTWGALFLVAEIAAWQDWVPWNTLSWTIWQLSARSTMVAMGVAGGMFILTLHFAFGFPNRGRFKREDTEGDR
jgi:hypothetical protein